MKVPSWKGTKLGRYLARKVPSQKGTQLGKQLAMKVYSWKGSKESAKLERYIASKVAIQFGRYLDISRSLSMLAPSLLSSSPLSPFLLPHFAGYVLVQHYPPCSPFSTQFLHCFLCLWRCDLTLNGFNRMFRTAHKYHLFELLLFAYAMLSPFAKWQGYPVQLTCSPVRLFTCLPACLPVCLASFC